VAAPSCLISDDIDLHSFFGSLALDVIQLVEYIFLSFYGNNALLISEEFKLGGHSGSVIFDNVVQTFAIINERHGIFRQSTESDIDHELT